MKNNQRSALEYYDDVRARNSKKKKVKVWVGVGDIEKKELRAEMDEGGT